jgi:glucose-1-phosphate cytidylyltransferase
MKVVLLCGGMGTRIREETALIPKPMIEIGRKPILWHIMKIYSHFGFDDFILCLGYKGDVIRRSFFDYHRMNCDVTLNLGKPDELVTHGKHDAERWRVTLAETGALNMTASRLWQIQRYLGDDETFMMSYGDGVASVDLQALLRFHQSHGRIATVTGVHPSSRWGELVVNGTEVTQFCEKPQLTEGLINGGFFVLNRKVFDYLSDDPTVPFERSPMSNLAATRQLRVYKHDGYWQAMDTLRDMTVLNEEWNNQQAAWKVWTQ